MSEDNQRFVSIKCSECGSQQMIPVTLPEGFSRIEHPFCACVKCGRLHTEKGEAVFQTGSNSPIYAHSKDDIILIKTTPKLRIVK